jgi:glycosyltransferase involved in cell wall biosynthesis
MAHNKYLIKSLAPWMIDELLAFSETSNFDIIFLRDQDVFYKDAIKELESRNIKVYIKPKKFTNFFKKLRIILNFTFHNLSKFELSYNGVLGLKSIWWFLSLDISIFSNNSNIHAQFVTQPALVSLLIKKYYHDQPKYSFTFHAHDIYFKNKWFDLLVENSHKSFSISEYNIEYINENYTASKKIVLSRLGVFRDTLRKEEIIIAKKPSTFTLGLMSRFVEKKGISYLLKSILKLNQQGHEEIKLILAGDGPLNEEITDFIKSNNLISTVTSLGRVKGETKEAFYNSLDAFILPSITIKNDQDGIPVVLMEAVAYGLPLISTKVSGIPEICIDNYNGYLIEEKNIEEIMTSILELSKDEIKIKKFSKNSLIISDKYDIRINSLEKIKNLEW